MTDRQRCTAKAKQSGQQCKAWAVPGATVCRTHGGRAPQVLAKAKQRVTEAEARADVARFAARTDIHPAEALLELVQYQAGVVAYWRARVEQVEDEGLEWGKTQKRKGVGPEGPVNVTTTEAKPHVAYTLLREAQRDLADYASAALKAGVEERKVRIAEQQGALVAEVIRRILGDLGLTDAQAALVGEVVPRHLRALAGGAT